MAARPVVEVDVVGNGLAHVYIEGVEDEGGRRLLQAGSERGRVYTLGEFDDPRIESNNWANLARKAARQFGLHGTVEINNEVTLQVQTFEV
ncbi:hypothetical protein [Micromonospora maritima]|uniref:hypothetical protein n=1 Tax=Micromonospora maritima TaxID=986711 RepID=UPI00157D32A5|nr:hypothetical protein [Micromonospora maritima]